MLNVAQFPKYYTYIYVQYIAIYLMDVYLLWINAALFAGVYIVLSIILYCIVCVYVSITTTSLEYYDVSGR